MFFTSFSTYWILKLKHEEPLLQQKLAIECDYVLISEVKNTSNIDGKYLAKKNYRQANIVKYAGDRFCCQEKMLGIFRALGQNF